MAQEDKKTSKKKAPRNLEFKYDGHTFHLNPLHMSKAECVKLGKWTARVLKWKGKKK